MGTDAFSSLAEEIIKYTPLLLAGFVLFVVGIGAGWITKRVVFQLCVMIRLDRFLRSFRWGREFSKADIRHALFNAIGNVSFALVFLVFLNAAFTAMQLTVLSSLIERSVLVVPRVVLALAILGVGWLIARWATTIIRRGLVREGIPRATLISRFSNTVLIIFFSAMALTELDIAREIVIIGFSVTIVTLGVIAGAIVMIGRRELVQKHLMLFGERKEEEPTA